MLNSRSTIRSIEVKIAEGTFVEGSDSVAAVLVRHSSSED
jgi:hypothetical protein